MPKAAARAAISRPISPMPTMPSTDEASVRKPRMRAKLEFPV